MSPARTAVEKEPAKSPGDETLVRQCLAGNESAWSALLDRYKALIYSVPVKFGLPPQDAADVFQTTCLELLVRLPELRDARALPKWLIQVAWHQCCQWKRQQQHTVSRDAQENPVEPQTPAVAESLVRETEEEQMLREAVQGLAPRCRRLVELLFYSEAARPYSEIAAELGVAVGSIGFIRQKCLERLRRRLDKMGFV